MTGQIAYQGALRCEAKHIQSGSLLETDAPTDNRGKGERFSPTDLLCISLGTCIITTMALRGVDMGIELKGSVLDVTKTMASDPRRIAKVEILLAIRTDKNPEEKERIILERIAHTCPVQKSLHPDLDVAVEFQWTV